MIPASHPLVGSSLRLQLGAAKLLGWRGWLRDDALTRRSIDFAGELISNAPPAPTTSHHAFSGNGSCSRDGIRTCWDSLRWHDGTNGRLNKAARGRTFAAARS